MPNFISVDGRRSSGSERAMYATLAEMIDYPALLIDGRHVISAANSAALAFFRVADTGRIVDSPIDQWLPAFNMICYPDGSESQNSVNASDGTWQFASLADGKKKRIMVQRQTFSLGIDAQEIVVLRGGEELQRLRNLIRRQQALINFSASPCIVQDSDGRIESVNPAFERTFGYTSKESSGKLLRELLGGKLTNVREMKTALEAVLVGGSIRRDEALYHRSGSVVWLSYEQHAVIDDLGEVSYIVTTGMDISGRKKAEQMKSDFVAMVGHELRTPLTVVSGTLDILSDSRFVTVSTEVGAIIQNARNNCDSLNVLIGDLMDINKIEAGLIPLDIRPVSPMECAAMAISGQIGRAATRGITLHHPQGEDDVFVLADEMRLRQILTNLISNAVKYGRDDGSVWTRFWVSGESVRIEISDDGPGIDSELRVRIFEKFTRAPEVAAKGIEGFGLGLSICKGLTEMMGGTIKLTSGADEGAAFCLSLPLSEMPGQLNSEKQIVSTDAPITLRQSSGAH